MSCAENDYLMISGIQHFMFCRRQWALIHIEQQWQENRLTAEGEVIHQNAHKDDFIEKRPGMDSYIGILHRDRPGRQSLALDLMEELRSVYADRFVLSLINNRVLPASCFKPMEDGAVLLNAEGRKTFLSKWQERKKETLTHPFLGEKIYWGLIPYVQALLLARYIHGDLDGYPPFLWK